MGRVTTNGDSGIFGKTWHESERGVVFLYGVLVLAAEHAKISGEIVGPRSQLGGQGAVGAERAGDEQGTVDAATSLGRLFVSELLVLSGRLVCSKTLSELFREGEEPKSQIKGCLRSLADLSGGTDASTLARSRRQIRLEELNGVFGFAGVELGERLIHRGSVALEELIKPLAAAAEEQQRGDGHGGAAARPNTPAPAWTCLGHERLDNQ